MSTGAVGRHAGALLLAAAATVLLLLAGPMLADSISMPGVALLGLGLGLACLAVTRTWLSAPRAGDRPSGADQSSMDGSLAGPT